jgi:hypothetical protein
VCHSFSLSHAFSSTLGLAPHLANATSLTMLSNGFVTVTRDIRGVLLSPGTEGVVVSSWRSRWA